MKLFKWNPRAFEKYSNVKNSLKAFNNMSGDDYLGYFLSVAFEGLNRKISLYQKSLWLSAIANLFDLSA